MRQLIVNPFAVESSRRLLIRRRVDVSPVGTQVIPVGALNNHPGSSYVRLAALNFAAKSRRSRATKFGCGSPWTGKGAFPGLVIRAPDRPALCAPIVSQTWVARPCSVTQYSTVCEIIPLILARRANADFCRFYTRPKAEEKELGRLSSSG